MKLFLLMSAGFVLAAQTSFDKGDYPLRSFAPSLKKERQGFNTPLPLEDAGQIIVELSEDYSKITLSKQPKPPEYKEPLHPEIAGSCQFSGKELVCNMDFNPPAVLRFVPDEHGRLKMYSSDDTFLTFWRDGPEKLH